MYSHLYGSVQLSSVLCGLHVYKTVWTPLALAFVAFKLICGSLSIVNIVCSAVVRCLVTTSHVLSHVPNNGCGGRLKTMRLTVKYMLNNEVRLTTSGYGIATEITCITIKWQLLFTM